jgi:hypothetical protein
MSINSPISNQPVPIHAAQILLCHKFTENVCEELNAGQGRSWAMHGTEQGEALCCYTPPASGGVPPVLPILSSAR